MRLHRPGSFIVCALVVLCFGCGGRETGRSDQPPVPTGPTGPVVLVGIATDEGGGDLPAVIEKHPDLTGALPDVLASSVTSQSAGFLGGYLVASIRVVGATQSGDEIWLYAHESIATYAREGGIARIQSARSVPIRIRLESPSLRVLGIDEPLDGASMGPSLAAIMPKWARERALPLEFDDARMQEVADRWAQTPP